MRLFTKPFVRGPRNGNRTPSKRKWCNLTLACKFSKATSNSLTYISLKKFPSKPRTFTPLSQIQHQRKQLESQRVSTLDGCEN
ncbi:unnamed protein product [Dovyalis caffra]|uniref:Ribosomal protein L32 n=1 Tax=Dovyalis caffra TaxID=77055 RepID=A0AAV1RRZ0_9ROSI|nr:unnamed protein product [Dovyalis caffra]